MWRDALKSKVFIWRVRRRDNVGEVTNKALGEPCIIYVDRQ